MADTKKVQRKTKKIAHKLFADKGITCMDNPTKYVVLCNAGQATGLNKEDLLEVILNKLPDIPVPEYVPVKGESYSFLRFGSLESAKACHDMCHTIIKVQENGPPIYMNYVDKVPDRTRVISEPNPTGLTVIENFINAEEEIILLKLFDWHEDGDSTGQLKNRQVKHYGYEFRYGTNDVDLSSPLDDIIPEQCSFILERLKCHNIHLSAMPDQLTVNKYRPGQGIPSHVDKHSPFGSVILSLSLGSSVVMDWRHHSGRYVPVAVLNRSMLVMTGEARYDWQHGIQARAWDPRVELNERISDSGDSKRTRVLTEEHVPRDTRISLTFRWTRRGPCECGYPALCDSRAAATTLAEGHVAAQLEELHVHEVYERIASHFSTTRHKRWPRVDSFVSALPAGSVLLDLGSGNGKNILARNDLLQIAAERSWGLLRECRHHVCSVPAADCLRADLLSAPCRDACADAVICIAVLHHFSNQERRVKAISEMCRLLRPGGTALITVWARDQAKANYLSASREREHASEADAAVAVAGVSLALPVHENRTQFRHSDVLVPWKLRAGGGGGGGGGADAGETLLRYYHVFEEGELDGLCAAVPGLRVAESFYEQGNWCVVCEKS